MIIWVVRQLYWRKRYTYLPRLWPFKTFWRDLRQHNSKSLLLILVYWSNYRLYAWLLKRGAR